MSIIKNHVRVLNKFQKYIIYNKLFTIEQINIFRSIIFYRNIVNKRKKNKYFNKIVFNAIPNFLILEIPR